MLCDGVRAGADQIDVGAAVDLHAAQEEGVDTALSGAVEELPPAVGHVAPGLAAEQADLRPAATAFAREQGGCARNRRRGPDRDTAEARKHAGNDLDEERSLVRAHSAAMRPAPSSAAEPVTCAAQ